MSNRDARRSAIGFTVVELLIIVGIMGVILTITVPTIVRARANAHLAHCMSNQKQVGEDIIRNMLTTRFHMPTIEEMAHFSAASTLSCPSDDTPFTLGAEAYGGKKDLQISYGFNTEYALWNVMYSQVREPSAKMVLFDWHPAESSAELDLIDGGDNVGDGDNDKDKPKKVMLIHFPPGNRNNSHVITVGAASLKAHLKHGDIVLGYSEDEDDGSDSESVEESESICAYCTAEANFALRHPDRDAVGNILFLDWHIESRHALDPGMFLYPGHEHHDADNDSGDGGDPVVEHGKGHGKGLGVGLTPTGHKKESKDRPKAPEKSKK